MKGLISVSVLSMSLFVMLIAMPFATQAGVYKWVDKQGRVHFGDQPPMDVSAGEIDMPEATAPESSASSVPDVSDIELRDRQKKMAEALSSDRKARDVANKQAADKKARRKAACEKLSARLKKSDSVNIYYRRNDKGEREFISDKERETLIDGVRKKYSENCK